MKNVIVEKSFDFALKVIKELRGLQRREKEYVISQQLMRSATSVGANIEEAQGAFSRKDFVHKLQLSLKEARESRYWLRLLKASDMLSEEGVDLIAHSEELIKILTSILKTSKAA